MKKLLLPILAIVAIAFGFGGNARAESAGKEITIEGKGCCAKCALKEASACQNAVTVVKGDKKSVYYFVENDIAKAFHENICKSAKTVKATGTCKKVDGKLEFTATKIELVE